MIEYIQEIFEENQKEVLIALGFWVIVMICLWVVPAKMGFDGLYATMKMNFLWFEVRRMVVNNIILSVLSLPIFIFIVIKMGDK